MYNRPAFPKRAVVTAGMPYGNKELHLGHIGGVFIPADMYARFLRDRIGRENVLFVSGTDCYGSPIVEYHRLLTESGEFSGTLEEFVEHNHRLQKEALDLYHIDIDLFAASGLGRASEIHRELSARIMRGLYENGHLCKLTTSQFYDMEKEVFLNGRQVTGRCPIAGCASDKGYADECSLGHQYMPSELLDPVSTLSGKKPEMRDVTNWYFDLGHFRDLLLTWADRLSQSPTARPFMIKSIREFLEPPAVYVKRDQLACIEEIRELPPYTLSGDGSRPSAALIFETLSLRERACGILTELGIRYRTGKTLVPFRLTGNTPWGVEAPSLEALDGLTFWVWPESLWAPISFTKALLESRGCEEDAWKAFWCSPDARVYQFIGVDNVYFYGPAEMAMFMALQGTALSTEPPEGALQLPDLIVNNHLLFLDKKASSSGEIKPPTAKQLLSHYTAEQLRAHFLGLGLGLRSVGFQPKPWNPNAGENDGDPVLKEGNLFSNVFNRAVRSCFYTAWKYYGGRIPDMDIEKDVLESSREAILSYEQLMAGCRLHQVMNLLDVYIRNINKYWSANMRLADAENNDALRKQVLVNAFHMVRTAAALAHPVAPEGTEMIRNYLGFGEEFWSWDHIFEPLGFFMKDPATHILKFLEPRTDFFCKHQSQIRGEYGPNGVDKTPH